MRRDRGDGGEASSSANARALLSLTRPAGGEGRRLALSVALSAGAAAAAIALLATSGYLISRAAQRPPILALMLAIVAVRAFGIARAGLRYGERLASHDLALRQLARLRTRFFARLAPLVPARLGGRSSGELLARFVADVDTLQDLHLRAVIPSAVALLVAAGAGVAAWVILPVAGLVVVGALVIAALALPWIGARLAASSGRHQAPARARLLAQLVESVDGAAELAVAGRSQERVEQLRASDARLARLARADAIAGALATGLGSAIGAAGLLALLLVAIPAVRSGVLSGVLLAALVFLFLAAYESALPLAHAGRRLHACATAASRLDEVCACVPAVVDPARPRGLGGEGGVGGEGELRVRSLRSRYGPDEPWVLDGIDLRLAPGRCVALVGPSGAGKSTLAELLVRFRDPDSGCVSLDGIDVRELAQEDLRHEVLLCGQDAHLFNTAVRENILLARRAATEGEVREALRLLELDEWVRGLPEGLDTLVGQDGEAVSGGQRQRIALARALVSDARFLILDEPTAHLDAPLARRVLRGVLEGVREGRGGREGGGRHGLVERGVLVVTHALDGLEVFDEVLELRGGQMRGVEVPGLVGSA